MSLDPVSADSQAPAFATPEACLLWVKTLPLSSPVQSQVLLLRELKRLNALTLDGTTRLGILEALRETSHFVQTENAKKFAGKALPLAPPEHTAFESNRSLWQALLAGYQHCLEAAMGGGDAKLRAQAGLICQRALAVLVEIQLDLLRAGQRPDGEHWRQAHLLYGSAEVLGCTIDVCADPLRGRPATPAAAYAEIMLLHSAGLHELLPRHQAWVCGWARRWAGKLDLLNAPPTLDEPALPLCVDLESNQPASFKPFSGKGARWLDTRALRKSLKKRIVLLDKNDPQYTPEALGLGKDCAQPVVGEILRRTYPRWLKGGVTRRFERHPVSGVCRFVIGGEQIHYYVSGHQPFKPPGNLSAEELRRQRDEIATFGRIAERFDDDFSRDHGYQQESWEVAEDWGAVDQTNGGLCIARSLKQTGGRVGFGQLCAVQPSGASSLVLGTVRWALIDGERLAAGIKLFPGKPAPVATRGTGVMAGKDPFRPGFLLPPVDALKAPASIILPVGSYKPARIMEVWHDSRSVRLKLRDVLDRGADYERVSFEEMAG